MSTDNGGVVDTVSAELNPTGEIIPPDGELVKGADPVQWDDVEGRVEPEFDPGEGVSKGPDAGEWGTDDERAEAAAVAELVLTDGA